MYLLMIFVIVPIVIIGVGAFFSSGGLGTVIAIWVIVSVIIGGYAIAKNR
ncbi:MAG: hypothetical protein HFJ26_04600 [Clostridia bacterium]|nr:hypothetical protein [Clostridia bacterium]